MRQKCLNKMSKVKIHEYSEIIYEQNDLLWKYSYVYAYDEF